MAEKVYDPIQTQIERRRQRAKANRLATVRELPPPLQTAVTFIEAVQELVDLGRQLTAKEELHDWKGRRP